MSIARYNYVVQVINLLNLYLCACAYQKHKTLSRQSQLERAEDGELTRLDFQGPAGCTVEDDFLVFNKSLFLLSCGAATLMVTPECATTESCPKVDSVLNYTRVTNNSTCITVEKTPIVEKSSCDKEVNKIGIK